MRREVSRPPRRENLRGPRHRPRREVSPSRRRLDGADDARGRRAVAGGRSRRRAGDGAAPSGGEGADQARGPRGGVAPPRRGGVGPNARGVIGSPSTCSAASSARSLSPASLEFIACARARHGVGSGTKRAPIMGSAKRLTQRRPRRRRRGCRGVPCACARAPWGRRSRSPAGALRRRPRGGGSGSQPVRVMGSVRGSHYGPARHGGASRVRARAAWGTAAASLGGDRVEVFGHFRAQATRAPARARRGVRPQPPPPGLEAPVALLARRAPRRRAAAASAMLPLRARVFHPSAGDHELARGRRRPPAGRDASSAATRRRRRATGASARGGAAGRPRAAARAAPAAARAARERALPSAERAPVLQPPWRRQRPPRPRPDALQGCPSRHRASQRLVRVMSRSAASRARSSIAPRRHASSRAPAALRRPRERTHGIDGRANARPPKRRSVASASSNASARPTSRSNSRRLATAAACSARSAWCLPPLARGALLVVALASSARG